MPRNSRFRRRPNNTGTVVKLSGKRRNPYCARVMSDERDIITGKKKQICIGTFATREEALNALSIYSLKRSSSITNEEVRNLAAPIRLIEYRKRLRRERQHSKKSLLS